MTERGSDGFEIRREDLTEEEVEQPRESDRLVIEVDDLPDEEAVGAPTDQARAFPGFDGPAPAAGLHVLAYCSSRKGEFVLELSPRKEGGYWMRVAKGKSTAGIGGTLTAQGPFVYEPNFACPHCGAHNVVVCECGALFCHDDKPKAVCPACQRKLRLAGLASHVEAYGGGKGSH